MISGYTQWASAVTGRVSRTGFTPQGINGPAVRGHLMKQSAGSRLHLALEFVEEAPVGVLGNELLRVGLDQSGFLHAQRVKPERVLGIIVAPDVVPDLAQRLQRIIIARRVSSIDEQLRRALGLGYAEIDRLEDCS